MNRQRVDQSRSQSKSSGIEVSGVLQRRGLVRTAAEQTMQREEETTNHSWTESPLVKNFKTIPLRSQKSRFQRSLSENEVKPSVVGESGLNRSFVNVPVHGYGLPSVQRSALARSASLPPFPQLLSQHPATENPSVSLGGGVGQNKNEMTVNSKASSEVSRPNQTGLPARLKTGIEKLSSYSMDNVRVHYNSDRPARLQAHAYTQGTNIYIAPGQEKHLPHEAWHVVQQMQGRVKPTMQAKGMAINDDRALEREADLMGVKAAAVKMQLTREQDKEKMVREMYVQNQKTQQKNSIADAKSGLRNPTRGKSPTQYVNKGREGKERRKIQEAINRVRPMSPEPVQRIYGPKDGLWPNLSSSLWQKEKTFWTEKAQTKQYKHLRPRFESEKEARELVASGVKFKWVLRQDGYMWLGDDLLPHSLLANNEDVETAGSGMLKPTKEQKVLVITNETGHYQTSPESVKAVRPYWEYFIFHEDWKLEIREQVYK